MCLGIPMQITTIEGQQGQVSMDGVSHAVDLSLIEAPAVGEYVIVHAGFAIERLRTDEAEERIGMFSEIAGHWREQQQTLTEHE